MPNGYGRGFGGRGGGWGWGFGFRGSSPPWPYVGLGRGGLPRCAYYLGGAAGTPESSDYSSYAGAWATPYYGETTYPGAVPYGYARESIGAGPYARQMTQEQELDFLKREAEAMRGQLEQIDTRIKELETE